MKKFSCVFLLTVMVFANSIFAQAEKFSTTRPDGVAPIGVMADHFHHKGHWMLSYRYMPMWMGGFMEGNEDVNASEVARNYRIATNEAQMHMHMLGVMFAPSHKVNIMAMGNYIQHEIHSTGNSHLQEPMDMKGFGDVSLLGMYKAMDVNRQSIHALLGFSNILDGEMSSKSVDPILGFNYLMQKNRYTFGIQSLYIHRLAEEEEKEIKMGNTYNATTWAAAKISDNISFSSRLKYSVISSISEKENHPVPMQHTMQEPISVGHGSVSGKEKVEFSLGGNFKFTEGHLKNVRLGIEAGLPIYQRVEGLQMKDSYFGTIGLIYPM